MADSADGPIVRVVELEKHFRREGGEMVSAIDGISLDIERGSMTAVLGPSGCGKTTLLRCVAGLEAPTGGEVWKGDQLLSNGRDGVIVPPERRDFGMMFQSYAVWPHMSVFENVAYPLKGRRRPAAEVKERVHRILDVVGIGHLAREYSARLSGGQQQRIALARALVMEPDVILFDEPLSNVDARVREDLRVEIRTMQERIGFAGLYVTHDQEEAMSIADRIAVLDGGKIAQLGTPREIYRGPTSVFVAGFVGLLNSWKGTVTSVSPEGVTVSVAHGAINVRHDQVVGRVSTGDRVVVVLRPEYLSIAPSAGLADAVSWRGTVQTLMFRGAFSDCFVAVEGAEPIRVRLGHDAEVAVGDEVTVTTSARSFRVIPDGSTNVATQPTDRAPAATAEAVA